jgi:dephospho-CoA kinase
MLQVGITGGIGSGKSTVCQVFHTLGIPVFKADDAAKYLMSNDNQLIEQIKVLLGNDVYSGTEPDRAKIGAIIFKDAGKLQQINALVHPATVAYYKNWLSLQNAPYVLKEAAIFFESGTAQEIDLMIGVYAPAPLRIDRVLKRGPMTRERAESIMSQQMNDEEKMKLCDYVIINDDKTPVIPQVLALHSQLLNKTK